MNKQLKKVSVIIPNYNGERYLERCIESLLKQTYTNYEIIVVENASTDNSIEILQQYHNKIQLITNEINKGFSGGVNDGIRASQAEYVLLVNNDTEAEAEFIETMVNAIEANKKIFSVSALMLRYDNRTIVDDAGDNYNILGWGYKRGDGQPMERYSKDSAVFSSCGGAAIYRRSILDKIGYFDEAFFAYMEDMDLAYRARNAGYINRYCASAKIYHIGSATSGSKYNSFKVQLAAQNNVYVIYKNMPWIFIILNFLFLIAGFSIKGLFFSVKGLGKEYKQGFIKALKTLTTVERQMLSKKSLIGCVKTQLLMIWYTADYIVRKAIKK